MIKKWHKFSLHLVFWYCMGAIILYLALGWPSVASGGDKKVTEGYYGSERYKLIEKPVRAKSGETITYGYIGNERVRIHSKPSKDGVTVTRRGYIGGRRVNEKETKDD